MARRRMDHGYTTSLTCVPNGSDELIDMIYHNDPKPFDGKVHQTEQNRPDLSSYL